MVAGTRTLEPHTLINPTDVLSYPSFTQILESEVEDEEDVTSSHREGENVEDSLANVDPASNNAAPNPLLENNVLSTQTDGVANVANTSNSQGILTVGASGSTLVVDPLENRSSPSLEDLLNDMLGPVITLTPLESPDFVQARAQLADISTEGLADLARLAKVQDALRYLTLHSPDPNLVMKAEQSLRTILCLLAECQALKNQSRSLSQNNAAARNFIAKGPAQLKNKLQHAKTSRSEQLSALRQQQAAIEAKIAKIEAEQVRELKALEEEIRSAIPQVQERKRQLTASEAEERRINNLICAKPVTLANYY